MTRTPRQMGGGARPPQILAHLRRQFGGGARPPQVLAHLRRAAV